MGMRHVWRDLTLNSICASPLLPRRVRWRLLGALGMNVKPCTISPDCWFGGTRVTIGEGSMVNYGCFFDTSARITIGSGCDIGMQSLLCTGTHFPGSAGRRAGSATSRPIVIEDGCWIGARTIILPGTIVRSGCVIGAGSVVTKSTEPNGVYVGSPAIRIRDA